MTLKTQKTPAHRLALPLPFRYIFFHLNFLYYKSRNIDVIEPNFSIFEFFNRTLYSPNILLK